MSKYYVRSRFYHRTTKAEAVIFTESEAYDMCRTNREAPEYDEYWDEFNTYEEAESYRKEATIPAKW